MNSDFDLGKICSFESVGLILCDGFHGLILRQVICKSQ